MKDSCLLLRFFRIFLISLCLVSGGDLMALPNTPMNTWVVSGGTATVLAIARGANGITYIGGDFTHVGGAERNRIAALDASGVATDWNPDANGTVHALAVSGDTVYAGGVFTRIGDAERNRIAALDASGVATDWNPDASGTVHALAVSGNTVYAGGEFIRIGGQMRNRIAALEAITGNLTAWDPNVNGWDVAGIIYALAVSDDGSTVYAGGEFRTMGGGFTLDSFIGFVERNNIAALDTTTGSVTDWNPNAPNPRDRVHTLAVSGSTVYAGGEFTSIGGQPRNYIAALDASGRATTWNPNASSNGFVYALAVSGNTVYAGGAFARIGRQARNRIAALDVNTGDATTWNPNANDQVNALAVSGNTLYAGGSFSTINGTVQNGIAVFRTLAEFTSSLAGGVEDSTPVLLGIRLSQPSTDDVRINYAVTGGTATEGVDYTLSSGTINIRAGSTTAVIPLVIIDDAIDEPDETVIVTLSNPVGAELGRNITLTYTIQDDETPPATALTIEEPSTTIPPNDITPVPTPIGEEAGVEGEKELAPATGGGEGGSGGGGCGCNIPGGSVLVTVVNIIPYLIPLIGLYLRKRK